MLYIHSQLVVQKNWILGSRKFLDDQFPQKLSLNLPKTWLIDITDVRKFTVSFAFGIHVDIIKYQ